MTTTNDTKHPTIIGAQLLDIFDAYEALADLIQSSDPETSRRTLTKTASPVLLLEVLNQRFRAILDQANQVGMLP